MKRVLKISLILIVIFMNMAQISSVYAKEDDKQTSTWSTQTADWWKPKEEDVGQKKIKNKANVIVTAIRNIGIVVSVLALMLIGIREMTASAEEKSVIKEALPGYLIGVVMVATVTFLPSLIYEIVKNS